MQTNTHTHTHGQEMMMPVIQLARQKRSIVRALRFFFRFGGFALANEWSANCSEMMLRLSMANPITGMIDPSPRHLRVTGGLPPFTESRAKQTQTKINNKK